MIQEDIISYIASSERMFHDIYPIFCGKEDCPPLLSFGPAVREYYLLHICVSGRGVFYANDRPHLIEKGQCFLIHPQEMTFYQADEKEPWSYVWIAFAGERVDTYLKLIGLSKNNPICQCADVKSAISYIDDILAHNTFDIANEFYIQSVLMKLFSDLIKVENASYQTESKNSNYYISKAISYIELHYQEDISVQKIADFLALNRSYVTELFSKTIHLSPQQFLTNFRITKAANFLTTTELPIESISYACGYANISSFSKAFKKIIGCSPSHYRKKKSNI